MAGTIDQLNFEVILDDKEFTAKVKQDIQLANQLNTSLSSLLNIKKQVGKFNQDDVVNNRKAQQIAVDTARAQEKINREHEKTVALKSKLNAQVEQINRGYQSQNRILNELKGIALGYLSIHGAGQLLSSLVRVTGEFELQKTTLAAMLGDLNKAEGIITRIQGLAVESPFQFKELTTYAKQLSAFSVPAQELYDTTKMLADISAGLGVGMDRIVLAYGQVRSAAFLRGQEVRQFTEAGIPILDELAKQFSELEGRAVSTGEVFDKISARLVPFEMVAKVFKDMTSEGGKFYNMQEVQAETLRGKISNLKDAYEVMLNEIGKGQSENLKGAVDWARSLMQNYEETGRTLVELVAAYGVYKAALLTLTIVTNNFALANSKLYTSLINATKWAINNPYAILAAGITAAGYAIYKNITALEGYEKVHKSFVETEEKYNASLSAEGVKLDALYAKLRLAKEGTEEYEKAKKQIYTQYAGYISDLKEEGVEVGNLATLYDSLKIKVEEYTKAKFRSLAQSDLDQTFEQEVSVVRDRYKTLVSEIESIRKNAGEEPLSAMDKEGLWQYIAGDIATLWDMAENPDLKRIKGVLASKILPFGDIAKELQGDLRKIKSTYASDMQAIINLYGETSDELAEKDPFKDHEEGDKSPADKIQEEINAVKRLRDAYETLAPYMNGKMLRKTLTALFPNADQQLIQSLDFRTKLTELAAELNKYDESASKRLLDSLSGERAGEIASAFKAIETYKNMLDSWLGEDFNLTGEGTAFDISKIIRDLNNQYAKINQKAIQASDLLTKAQMGDEKALKTVREVYGEEVWQKYMEEGKSVIEDLANKEREEARKTAQEKINALVGGYVKDRTSNLNLQDWGDKSIGQVRKIKDAFDEISNSEIELPDSLKRDIEKAGLTIDEFTAKVKEAFSAISEEIDEEMLKKIVSLGKLIGEQVLEISSSLKELGDASGNAELSNIANAIQEIGDTFTSIIDGFKDGGVIGGIVAGISSLATKVIDAVVAQEKLARAIEETANQQRILNSEYAIMEGYEGIFGENAFKRFTNAYEEATKAYKDVQKDLERQNSIIWGGTDNDSGSWGKIGGLAGGAALGAAIGSIFPVIGTAIGAGIGALVGMITGTITDAALEADNYAKSLQQMADEIGAPLINEDTGVYNLETLKAIKDTYEDLSEEDRKWLENAITNVEIYENALSAMADYMSSVFSGVADDISDAFIESFRESGQAALDYGDIMDGVATQIAKDIIKATLLQEVFDDELAKNAAKELASGNVTGAMAMIDEAIKSAQALTPYMQEFLQSMEPYFDMGKEGTTDLGQGIKGITEDQANLLASYLNAIRADVAYSKTLWVRMDANLQRLAEMFTSSPTLMEYQAQIAANTYNTAIATQEILSELRSVVTTDSGDTAIRVYS